MVGGELGLVWLVRVCFFCMYFRCMKCFLDLVCVMNAGECELSVMSGGVVVVVVLCVMLVTVTVLCVCVM